MGARARRWVAGLLVTVLGATAVDASAAQASTGFTDVPASHVFVDDIAWLADREITTGYADGTFRPGQPVLREQMAAFLYRYAGSPPVHDLPTTSGFTDVPTSHVFFTEIVWLARSGITTGYDDGTFRPGQPVLREQMAAFLHRLAGKPVPPLPEQLPFSDVPVAHVFFDQILWLAQQGVSTGYGTPPHRTFVPSAPVLREQMAAFLHRLDGVLELPSTAQPVIVGVVAPGQTVRAELGSWDPGTDVGHRWFIDGQPVPGATSPTYSVRSADVGRNLTVKVSGMVSGSAPFSVESTVVPVPATSTTLRVAGSVPTGTTWGSAGVDTIAVAGDVLVPAGTTLTIAPGTGVVVDPGRAIEVAGGLVARGTADQPIGFGTPTNTWTDGRWRGIRVLTGGSVDAAHVVITAADVGIAGEWPGPVASFSVQDATFSQIRDYGIYLAESSTSPVVRNIRATAGLAPVALISSHLDPSLIDVNSPESGSVTDAVLLGGTIAVSGSFPTGLIPYGVAAPAAGLTVAPGVTLTVPAGQVWTSFGRSIDVEGELVAEGTAVDPVVFTSIRDYSSSEPTVTDGDWEGIHVRDGGRLSLTYAEIRFATFGVKADRSPQLSIADSLISVARTGLFVYDGPPESGPWVEQQVVRTRFERITDTAIVLNNARLVATDLSVHMASKVLYSEYGTAVLAGQPSSIASQLWVQALGSRPQHEVDVTQFFRAPGMPMQPFHACGPVTTADGPAPSC